jgi:hypothetical protein
LQTPRIGLSRSRASGDVEGPFDRENEPFEIKRRALPIDEGAWRINARAFDRWWRPLVDNDRASAINERAFPVNEESFGRS